MNELDLIFSHSKQDEIINLLKEKSVNLPHWSSLVKDYEPSLHRIMSDNFGRKDKVHKDGNGNTIGIDKASRICVGMEKLHTKRMTEFVFGIPIRRVYHNTDNNKIREQIARSMELIYKHAHVDNENIIRGNAYFASCEVCTIWYAVEKPNTLYGFPSKYKLKCKTFSPMNDTYIYPYFDGYGDLLALSIEYKTKLGDDAITHFETYTANRHYKWKEKNGEWIQEGNPEIISIGKIPGIYMYRLVPVYHGLSHIREEIEYTLSRNSDVVAYNSAPVLKVVGEIQGSEEKGESRRIFRLENGGDVSYVSWSQSIEALKYHVDILTKTYWTQAQMPDISFDNMKALGNIGYDARQTLLTDAHLKVKDESGVILEFLEREANVIKAFLGQMNKEFASELDNVEVEHIITPFIQNDETLLVDRLQKMNGGKALMSQLESIKQAGYSSNPEITLTQIQQEEADSQVARINSIMNEGAI